MKEKGQRC